jgi:hypothetical protein
VRELDTEVAVVAWRRFWCWRLERRDGWRRVRSWRNGEGALVLGGGEVERGSERERERERERRKVDGIREIGEVEIRGGNVMHERQSEERQQQHMWSPPSQRSAVGNPADQKVFTKVATCCFARETPVTVVGVSVEARMWVSVSELHFDKEDLLVVAVMAVSRYLRVVRRRAVVVVLAEKYSSGFKQVL